MLMQNRNISGPHPVSETEEGSRAPSRRLVSRAKSSGIVRSQKTDPSGEGSTSIACTLSQALGFVKEKAIGLNLPEATVDGTEELSSLQDEFLNSNYDYDKIKAAVRNVKREKELFFIPTELDGRMFVARTLFPSNSWIVSGW